MLKYLLIVCFFGATYAQIPSFGGCPEYEPMTNFNKTRFLGTWYESERYFTVSEVGTRCVQVTYEYRPDGKLWVNNAYTSRLNNVQRIVSGVVGGSVKGPDSVFKVHYQSFPVNYDTNLQILDTDYENFAVIYSCTRIGPVAHTESAWVFTRERNAGGPALQQAYGILDKYRISRTFFVKTDQKDCDSLPPPVEADLTKEGEAKSATKVEEKKEEVEEKKEKIEEKKEKIDEKKEKIEEKKEKVDKIENME